MAEITLSGDISQRTAAYAAVRLLKRHQFLTVTERFGQARPMPKNKSDTIKFRRYESLVPATAPLAEGVTPQGQKMRYTDVQAVLQFYGDVVWITNVIQDTHEDPVLNEAMDECGEQASETIERLRIAKMKAGATVFYANNVAGRSTVNSTPSVGDLRRIVRFLNKRKAKKISKIVKASALVSTEPVASAFFGLCSTDVESDLREMAGFTPVEQYSSSDRSLPGEVGKCEQIRFICTPLFEPWEGTGASGTTYLSGGAIVSAAASCDVYPIIIVAQDSYAIIPLQGKNAVSVAVKRPDTIEKSDPIGQRGFASWSTWQTSCVLNDDWLVRYEIAVTAVP